MATVGGRAVQNQRAGGDLASGYSGIDTGQRESLSNFISMITRDETPFISSIGKTKTNAIYHEWQTDELGAPGFNRLGEGTDYADISLSSTVNTAPNAAAYYGTNRTRLGNYCQISGKTLEISNTRRAIDVAGVADEYAYQLKKRGTELRRDQEFAMINGYQVADAGGARPGTVNQGNAAGATGGAATSTYATPRTAGGPQAFFNDERVSLMNGATAPTNQGVGTATPTLTNVTGRAFLSLNMIDQTMQNLYEEGGKANKLMVSPSLRRDFSNLVQGESTVRRNLDEKGKLRQSVDVYMSDFGDVMVVPNYIMGMKTSTAVDGSDLDEYKDSWAFLYDPQWMKMVQLRPLHEIDIRPQGDSTKGMMIEEWSFEVTNPLGCAGIYNLKSGVGRVAGQNATSTVTAYAGDQFVGADYGTNAQNTANTDIQEPNTAS